MTELLAIVRILVREQEIKVIEASADQLTRSIDQTYELRQEKLKEFRKIEQAVRRVEN